MSSELDRQAIIDLTIAYCWAIDDREFDNLRTVFRDDAIADFGQGPEKGVDAIIARISTVLNRLDASHHMVSNHQVKIDGDTAACRCYVHAQHVRRGIDGGRNFVVAGNYVDELVRTNDVWRIARRDLSITWTDGNRAVLADDGEATT